MDSTSEQGSVRAKRSRVTLDTYIRLRPEHKLRCEPFRKWAARKKLSPLSVREWDQQWAIFEALG